MYLKLFSKKVDSFTSSKNVINFCISNVCLPLFLYFSLFCLVFYVVVVVVSKMSHCHLILPSFYFFVGQLFVTGTNRIEEESFLAIIFIYEMCFQLSEHDFCQVLLVSYSFLFFLKNGLTLLK